LAAGITLTDERANKNWHRPVPDAPLQVQTFIAPAPDVNYGTTERSNFPSKLVSCRTCSSMLVFGEPMRWVTCIAAPILLADVGDRCFGVYSLDLKRGDERIFGVHGDMVRSLSI